MSGETLPNDNATAVHDLKAATDANGSGSGSDIAYNPDKLGENIRNEDGTTGRPPQIGLIHELSHAFLNSLGRKNSFIATFTNDPDTKFKGIISMEEIDVRTNYENPARKEQFIKPRATNF
ncbi:M91 family zinc metallopeptidase [Terrimonas ginsenosidimutans]|uniref:M91 family zinc metallopeptidase n=1 Tax=Terrimonas ginsenosidimutans TaxID=2908004 RepID=UPI003D7A45A9